MNGSPRLRGGRQRVERRAAAVDGGRPCLPARQLGVQNSSIDGIVVDDEHAAGRRAARLAAPVGVASSADVEARA